MAPTAKLSSERPTKPLSFVDKLAASVLGGAPAPANAYEPGSYEAVLKGKFHALRFPPEMEARYLSEKEPERLRLLRMGSVFALVLAICMLGPDWMMLPDQIDNALRWRLLIHMPVVLCWLVFMERLSAPRREWGGMLGSIVFSVVTAALCVSSKDNLAPPYLVSLAMVLLFNGGVARMRFWHALAVDVVILFVFCVALSLLNQPPIGLMACVALVLLATSLFGLYGCYWLEHEERTNWLMLKIEFQLYKELDDGNQRLDELSRHDALTGLANRRHVDDFLQQVWERARQSGDEVALLMMDIDHFKRFNDHYGHPEGDACLKDVATALKGHLRRPGDLVGRFGGEEFIAVLAKSDLAMATAAAERVRAGVRQLGRAHADSPTHEHVTVSIGAASLRPRQNEFSPARLLALADKALYAAKSSGRDQVCAMDEQGRR